MDTGSKYNMGALVGTSPKMLTNAEAIEEIRRLSRSGIRILGVDGFVRDAKGFVASLDLILDVSQEAFTNENAAAAAEAFIRSNEAENILFQIWTE